MPDTFSSLTVSLPLTAMPKEWQRVLAREDDYVRHDHVSFVCIGRHGDNVGIAMQFVTQNPQ